MPDHPLWQECRLVVMLHGGNLADFVTDLLNRSRAARHEQMNALSAASAPAQPPAPEPASTGPP
jgi:hypothetical protein